MRLFGQTVITLIIFRNEDLVYSHVNTFFGPNLSLYKCDVKCYSEENILNHIFLSLNSFCYETILKSAHKSMNPIQTRYTGWPRSYRKYILQITPPSQYGYAKLQHRFAVTSGSPSILLLFMSFQFFLLLHFDLNKAFDLILHFLFFLNYEFW